MKLWWVVALLCGCNSLPDKWVLKGDGITVEVTRAPYGYSVRDGSGKLVLQTAGAGSGDGYGSVGWTTGRVDWMPIATIGYYQFDTVFDKWRDAGAVTAVKQTTDRLEVTLGDGSKIVHQLRASTLRVEASRGDKPRAWSAAFQTPSDEDFLGLGERYNKVNQRGHSMYSWQEEGGLSKGEAEKASPSNPYPNGEAMTYYPVPFLISTAGYGFWLDSTWRNQFDLATDKPDRWRAWHIGPTLNYEIYVPISGDARPWPLQVIDLFTAVTGRPMVPVGWSFGPRRRINRNAMVGGVLEAQRMRDEGLAISAADDANHYLPRGGGLDANDKAYQDVLVKLGYKPVCYFNPYISTDPAYAAATQAPFGLDHHYYLQLPDGTPSTVWLISGGSANVYTVDVSNPDAATWFTDKFEAALKDGYRGWMYDFGEYVQPEVLAYNGMTGEEFHNLFPVLYDKAAYDGLASGNFKYDWYYFSRSGYTGSQKYAPMVWSGDPDASFSDSEGLPAQVRAGINMGVSGVANWGSDIGGYKCITDGGTAANGELLARWIEAGSMNSNMHDEDACAQNNDGVPKATIWTSDDAKTAWKIYAKLHTRMFPYIWALANEANRTGTPLIQHVFLQHPEARFAGIEDAHYFGPSLLVAPVVARGATQKNVTLPDGDWLEWQPDGTAQLVSGTVTLDAPLTKLPMLIRDGHLLPLLDASIETLVDPPVGAGAEDGHPGVIGPKEVADVYDVVGFITKTTGKADFTLADGTQLTAMWSGGFDTSAVRLAADTTDLASCESCYLEQDLTGMKHVLVSSTSAVKAGGLSLQSTAGRRIRWDLYLTE